MALTSPSSAPVLVDPRPRPQMVVAVMLGLFPAALDQPVVGTALPRIVTDLHGNDIYTWAFTAYLLTATISGPIYGKLSDLFGRRPVLLFAVAVFLIGSLLAGLSREMWQLVGFRALQGLGAGALFPIALAVIGDLFEPSERGKYQGLVGAVFGLSSLIGPAIGGIITDTVGWHWVFFVNLPIGAVVFAVIWRTLPRARPSATAPRIDYLGATVLVAALVPILVGLTNKQSGTWGDPAVGGLIALGLAITAVFVWIESRAIDLFVLSTLRADTPLPLLWTWMFITGLGVGPIFSIFTLVVQGAVPLRQIGTATSNLTLFQQVGGSVGLAAAGTVFGTRLVEELPRQLAASSLPPQIIAAFPAAGGSVMNRLTGVGDLGQAILASAPAGAQAQLAPFVPEIVGAIHRAFSLATASTFDFGIAAALVAAVMVVFLREAPVRGPVREEATAAPPLPDRQPSPLAREAGE